jgi:hypothetical protein
MAAKKRSSAKRSSRKRSSAKRTSARKGAARKATSRSRTRAKAPKTKTLTRTARKGLRVARGGIDTVRQAGEKTWEALKSTTAQVVEGVKDKFGDNTDRGRTYP